MKNKEYRQYCINNSKLPIFYQPWWLDCLCGVDNWVGLIVKNDSFVKAIWPLQINTLRFGRKYYTQPIFTPYLGILFNYPPEQKNSTRLAYEKEVIGALIKQLGHFSHLGQCFHSSFQNWLPLYWNGYQQTTYYTYQIHNIKNTDIVFRNFQENIRREVRKASKLGVRIDNIDNVDLIYTTLQKTMARQNKAMSYTKKQLEGLIVTCKKNSCINILGAFDFKNNCHAVAIIVWDSNTAYYLLGGGDPSHRNSGVTSLLMWEAIRFAATKTNSFDFEGSMIESVERFFRAFGAEQTPYFSISKTTKTESHILKLIAIKNKIIFLK